MIHLRLPFVKSLVQSYGETDRHIARKKTAEQERERERDSVHAFYKERTVGKFQCAERVYTHKLTDTVMRNLY